MRLNNTSRRLAALVGVTVLLAGCGADTTELDTARAEAASAEEQTIELQAQLDAATQTIASLETDAETTDDTLETQQASADELRAQITTLEGDLAAKEAELVELQLRFDPEIKAAASAAWDAELARACDEAGADSGTIASYVDYSDDMAAIGTRAELVDAVTACAEPLRNRSAEEKLDADCAPGDVDAVLRDTTAFVGDCLVIHVIPWQWDSRTGECTFLGSWDPNNLGVRYAYKYDGDGVFRAGPLLCSAELADADQDDLLKVWVEVTGTFRYDTAAGGTNEIPDFTLRKVELIAKG